MSKKKSPNIANTPSVDEIKVEEGENDVESPVVETSTKPESDNQNVVLSEKPVSPVQNDTPASSADGQKPTEKAAAPKSDGSKSINSPKVKRSFPFLGLLNLLLIIGLMAAAFYYWRCNKRAKRKNKPYCWNCKRG